MRQAIEQYQSRRNHAQLVRSQNELAVEKQFFDQASFRKEQAIYQSLHGTNLPSAKILETGTDYLLLSYLPGQTYLHLLEQQETTGRIDYRPWEQLVHWLLEFHRATGQIMTDLNLRNFIYDAKNHVTMGLDFEECTFGHEANMVASLAAFIRLYEPRHSEIKRKISSHIIRTFAEQLDFPPHALFGLSLRKETLLLDRRLGKKTLLPQS